MDILPDYSLTPEERETVIISSDGSDIVRIWTSQRTVKTILNKSDLCTLIAEDSNGATYAIASQDFNLAAAVRPKRRISEKQRQAASQRLKDRHKASD